MTKGHLRCKNCRRDYKPFKDTWLDTVNINYASWLILLKLFDLGISARKDAKEVGVSYPTALATFDSIRYSSILHQLSKKDHILKGEIETDEAYFGEKEKEIVVEGQKTR